MAAPRKVMFLGLLAGLMQLALALVAWGGWTPFFAHPALVALAWVSVAILIVAPFSSGNTSSGIREDRGNRWVLTAFSLIAIFNAYFPAYTDRKALWTLDGDATRWIGVVLYALGGMLRLWPVFVLGKRFSGLVAIQPGHTLETGGIYGVVRNPSYLGMLIMMLGWALSFRSIVGLLFTVALLIPLIARIHAEERLLHDHFSSQCDTYREHTWRLLPGLY